jgi:hypothetical protein
MFWYATDLSGNQAYAISNNQNATKEPGESNHAGYYGGKSLWWRWTSPSDGPVTISTTGSDFDTILGVYRWSWGDFVAGDDDHGGNRTSSVTFNAFANTVYYIAVDGYGGASGNIALSVKQP